MEVVKHELDGSFCCLCTFLKQKNPQNSLFREDWMLVFYLVFHIPCFYSSFLLRCKHKLNLEELLYSKELWCQVLATTDAFYLEVLLYICLNGNFRLWGVLFFSFGDFFLLFFGWLFIWFVGFLIFFKNLVNKKETSYFSAICLG